MDYVSFSVYVFPVEGKDKSEWVGSMEVKCGWAKEWDPPKVPSCVDPRGCKPPPERNDRVWGSFEDLEEPTTDVGDVYWYECRKGKWVISGNYQVIKLNL